MVLDRLDFTSQREQMVRTQIEARGVTAPAVLAALRSVPRERFVPPDAGGEAYADRALPIGLGQTISQPYMVAVMTAALDLSATAHVLEIGTGSGYQAAVLSRLSHDVVTIERHAALAEEARARLASLGYDNVRVVVGDGTEGAPVEAPFDGILVTAGAPRVPTTLQDQLADGGRLVIPVGPAMHQELLIVSRQGETFQTRRGDACVFVPLVGRHGWDS
jgi:protein-L-isoaspartate(D-aspartate) O-methyltransferase